MHNEWTMNNYLNTQKIVHNRDTHNKNVKKKDFSNPKKSAIYES